MYDSTDIKSMFDSIEEFNPDLRPYIKKKVNFAEHVTEIAFDKAEPPMFCTVQSEQEVMIVPLYKQVKNEFKN